MPTSFPKALGIQEIIEHLASYLDQRDISKLLQTCKLIHQMLLPTLYTRIKLMPMEGGSRLLISPLALSALERNMQHVRELTMGVTELAFYHYGVLSSKNAGLHTANSPLSVDSKTLSQPNDPACQVVALSPFTRLTTLHITFGEPNSTPYTMPIIKDHRATLSQICQLISLNPGLTELHMNDLRIMDIQGGQLLGGAIAGLSRLERLHLGIYYVRRSWFVVMNQLFFNCPQSIRSLALYFFWDQVRYPPSIPEEFLEGYSEEVVAVAPSLEPLENLEELKIDVIRGWDKLDQISLFFKHCPNIKKLELDALFSYLDIDITGIITVACPKIESIHYGCPEYPIYDLLAIDIMETLPAQQLLEIDLYGSVSDGLIPDLEAAFLRHSTVLRSIHIKRSSGLKKISLSTILNVCCSLEMLLFDIDEYRGIYDTLNAIQYPWACINIRQLVFGISGCELPVEENIEPYYARSTPITLTEAEKQHFARLEALYQQIGALKELQNLNIQMIDLNDQNRTLPRDQKTLQVLPAFLSLGDPSTGRPGFLHHLAGLENLEHMRGSISAFAKETKVTMGWPEAKWMHQHWPKLRIIELFELFDSTEPFEWLEEERTKDHKAFDIYGMTFF
ncbi:hypothetical protein FBU30_000348 [Linnemannia zychae]|nr:hypothetical protein FBU30_000348 [Linnemannia zychae]